MAASLSVDSETMEVQARESEEKPDRYDVLITFPGPTGRGWRFPRRWG
ncbi:MAG: hypothetical protein MPW16_01210 [Candidatus Manganitrophus sp.]|nr:MAG: hypothetical protein MPW16_01210 [Candidatus Manganitrophus sp.]